MRKNAFEENIQQQLGEEAFNKVSSVKVGIAGAGGLGSNCACNLVRAGFKNLRIVDFDRVDHSNLNRQFYFLDQVGMDKVKALEVNLRRINPDVNLESRVCKIERSNAGEIFSDCDIVVEAFDRAEYKSMIVEELLPLGKFIVSASGLAGYGSSDQIRVRRIKDNLVIVGDMKTDVSTDFPVSPRVNVAAAKQADVALEYVLTGNLS
jgi:sulfur carrier protein ThiS adenylyltransferase